MIGKKQTKTYQPKNASKDQCDIFCFQECSDKYEELVVVKGHEDAGLNEESTKFSLKRKYLEQKLTKLPINNRASSQQQGYRSQQVRTQTNRSKQSYHGNVYDLQLFRKKNKIETEIIQIQKQMKRLSEHYEEKLNSLVELKNQIRHRKDVTRIEQPQQTRHKMLSVFESTKSKH